MLLQQIVATLDGELQRLLSLREIVSGLAGPSVLELQASNEPVEEAKPAPANGTPAKQERPRRVLKPRSGDRKLSVKRAKPQPEATALTGAIPATPVVVTAEALAKEGARLQKRSAEKKVEPAAAPGTLGLMIRALRLEANS